MFLLRQAAALFLALAACGSASAQDWTNWRGPHFNGSADAVGLPDRFSRTENVKWAAELPGPSAGTPIIFQDRVFVTSADLKAQELVALCLDRKSGKTLWKHNVCSGYQPGNAGTRIQLDERSNYASPSPVTDGKRVVFFYGNGDLICFDLAGNRLWNRNIQKDYGDFAFQWTFSSSPQFYEGRLYLQVLQRNQATHGRGKAAPQSFLLAMDPPTGKELWRSVRASDAQMESLEAYSTPIPFTHNGRKELVIAGGDVVTGHDPATGREYWRWGTWNPDHRETWWRLVPSPVPGAGVVMVCAPKRNPVYVARAGGSGDLGPSGLVWKSEERSVISSDVPTPLFYQNRFFVLSDVRKALSCVNPADGKILWTTPLPGTEMCWGSPTGADGKIYVLSLSGEVFVLDAASGSVLSRAQMAEEERDIRATIAVAYNQLFIRTNTKLYCVGK